MATRFTTNGRPIGRGTKTKLMLLDPLTSTEPGEYTVVVKVIDILGNDTTKTLSVIVGNGGRHGS